MRIVVEQPCDRYVERSFEPADHGSCCQVCRVVGNLDGELVGGSRNSGPTRNEAKAEWSIVRSPGNPQPVTRMLGT